MLTSLTALRQRVLALLEARGLVGKRLAVERNGEIVPKARHAEVKLADGDKLGEGARSARNHLTGLVTRVVSDKVMSQVELQCGRFRIVSLISTEAVQELGLEPGVVATAVIKATNVTIERNRA